jgi:phosphohistidine phosphatase SixA
MTCRSLFVLATLGACSSDSTPARPDARSDVVVHVVRHAETGSTATDPPLDATGQARAATLASLLGPANVTAIFTSQFRRTQDTAMPTAIDAGVAISVIEIPANGTTYGDVLVAATQDSMATSALIVGHSNTVPDTVKAFTGIDVPPISESEFDRIYTITLAADGPQLVEGTY